MAADDDDESWIATERPRNPNLLGEVITLHTAEARCFQMLLSHYDTFIVYLGYSLWRKMLIMQRVHITQKNSSGAWAYDALVGDIRDLHRYLTPGMVT